MIGNINVYISGKEIKYKGGFTARLYISTAIKLLTRTNVCAKLINKGGQNESE